MIKPIDFKDLPETPGFPPLDQIIYVWRDGTLKDKAVCYNTHVDYLIKEIHALRSELARYERFYRENADVIERLQKLEQALGSIGYSRGPTG